MRYHQGKVNLSYVINIAIQSPQEGKEEEEEEGGGGGRGGGGEGGGGEC